MMPQPQLLFGFDSSALDQLLSQEASRTRQPLQRPKHLKHCILPAPSSLLHQSKSSSPQASAHADCGARSSFSAAINELVPRNAAQPHLSDSSFHTLLGSDDCHSLSQFESICFAWNHQPEGFEGAPDLQESKTVASSTASAGVQNTNDASHPFTSTPNASYQTKQVMCNASDSRRVCLASLKDLSKSLRGCLAAVDAMHAEVMAKCKTGYHVVIKEPKLVKTKLVLTRNHCQHRIPHRSRNAVSKKGSETGESCQMVSCKTGNCVSTSSTVRKGSRSHTAASTSSTVVGGLQSQTALNTSSSVTGGSQSQTLVGTLSSVIEESQSQTAVRRRSLSLLTGVCDRDPTITCGKGRRVCRKKGGHCVNESCDFQSTGKDSACRYEFRKRTPVKNSASVGKAPVEKDQSLIEVEANGTGVETGTHSISDMAVHLPECTGQSAPLASLTVPEADHQVVGDDDSDVCSVTSDRSGIIRHPKRQQSTPVFLVGDDDDSDVCSVTSDRSGIVRYPKHQHSRRKSGSCTSTSKTPPKKKRNSSSRQSCGSSQSPGKTSQTRSARKKVSLRGKNQRSRRTDSKNSPSLRTPLQNSKSSAKRSANLADISKTSRSDVNKKRTSTGLTKTRALKDRNITGGSPSAVVSSNGVWKKRKIADRSKSPRKTGSLDPLCHNTPSAHLRGEHRVSKRVKLNAASSFQSGSNTSKLKTSRQKKKQKRESRGYGKNTVKKHTKHQTRAETAAKKSSPKGQQTGQQRKVLRNGTATSTAPVCAERKYLKRKSDSDTPNHGKKRNASVSSPKKPRKCNELMAQQSAVINHHVSTISFLSSLEEKDVFSPLALPEEEGEELDISVMEELCGPVKDKQAQVNIYSRKPQKNRFGFRGPVDEDAHAGGVWQSILAKK